MNSCKSFNHIVSRAASRRSALGLPRLGVMKYSPLSLRFKRPAYIAQWTIWFLLSSSTPMFFTTLFQNRLYRPPCFSFRSFPIIAFLARALLILKNGIAPSAASVPSKYEKSEHRCPSSIEYVSIAVALAAMKDPASGSLGIRCTSFLMFGTRRLRAITPTEPNAPLCLSLRSDAAGER